MPRVTARDLASKVAKKEGHRSQARIGDIREIIGILADEMYDSADVHQCLIHLGIARAKRRKSAKA